MEAVILNGSKQCRYCLEWKPTSSFGSFLDKKKNWTAPKRYLNSRCKRCASKIASEWAQANRARTRERWLKNKEDMLSAIRNAYGGKCACCGESSPLFLTIDHVNNDGYKLRPRNKNGQYNNSQFSGHYYKQIIKAGFPKNLQLLCWNCNCGRARNKGVCPHVWK